MQERDGSCRRVSGIHRRVWFVLLVMAVPTGGAMGQSSSSSYVLQQSTLDISGDRMQSATYRLTASLGQEMTVGTSSSDTLVLQSGFWSFVGSGIVPVVLTVDRNDGMPGNVDLTWSGNNPPYGIYQGTDCSDIFASFLTSTTNNGLANITPPLAELVCYSVLATAPGPTVPGETPTGAKSP